MTLLSSVGILFPTISCRYCYPDIDDYLPDGSGKAPLARHPKFYETTCPACGGPARRETDVSDTFLDSSWYFLRYPSTVGGDVDAEVANKTPFDTAITQKWLPVSQYCGGAEHSVLHLMYSRFVTMALHDLGYLSFEEPFPRFYAHGMIIKDGAKMSKSKGNIINPDEYMDKYGTDTLRLYMAFMGPYSEGGDFRDTGIAGMHKFVRRIWNNFYQWKDFNLTDNIKSEQLDQVMHRSIYKVSQSIEQFKYNTAIAALMEFMNTLEAAHSSFVPASGVTNNLSLVIKNFLLLLAPFAPHISEELWQHYSKSASTSFVSVHQQTWPFFDKAKMQSQAVTLAIQVNGKLRGTIELSPDQSTDEGSVMDMVMEQEVVKKYIEGKTVCKHIFVSGKLVNLVVS
jgi:leucyl-tRNA synthetase